MIALRLKGLQLALAGLAAALFLAAVTMLLLPADALPRAGAVRMGAPAVMTFDLPLYAVANDPESPLVERNPFDATRRPPAKRRTMTTEEENAAALAEAQNPPPTFKLLGTVLNPRGRNMAVISGNPLVPGGSSYHVGDEVQPGFRVTRITRDAATIVGKGQRIDLTIQAAAGGAMAP
jgi:hypothetical protein